MSQQDKVAFDAVAQIYDSNFSQSLTGSLQRSRTRAFLDKELGTKNCILEINCGTGEDLVWLASKGHTVRATDISPAMIEVCKKKIELHSLNNAKASVCSFSETDRHFSAESFDLIFSNFGGLNCISPEDMKDFSEKLVSLLKPNGRLVIVLMGRKCLWETAYFLFKINPKEAFRRRRVGPVTANIDNKSQQLTWYYSPKELQGILDPHFNLKALQPVGLFVPPSYLDNYFSRKPAQAKFLSRMEKNFGNRAFFANYADHYIACFQKK